MREKDLAVTNFLSNVLRKGKRISYFQQRIISLPFSICIYFTLLTTTKSVPHVRPANFTSFQPFSDHIETLHMDGKSSRITTVSRK